MKRLNINDILMQQFRPNSCLSASNQLLIISFRKKLSICRSTTPWSPGWTINLKCQTRWWHYSSDFLRKT